MHSLTILVPTRNRPGNLECCLNSILDAFGPGQEVIIGDNGDPEPTAKLIKGLPDLRITHIRNPPGGTYVKNIQILMDSCPSEWLCILHDDDFFGSNISGVIGPTINDPSIDFVFSDHWICDTDGVLNVPRSTANTQHYGRHLVSPGIQSNLGVLAVKRSVCLDGFYVRTRLARSVRLDTTSPTYSDMKWLIEICDAAAAGYFIPERLFTYRSSLTSLTTTVSPVSAAFDQWLSLRNTTVRNRSTRKELKKRQLQTFIQIFRSSAHHLIGLVRSQKTPTVDPPP